MHDAGEAGSVSATVDVDGASYMEQDDRFAPPHPHADEAEIMEWEQQWRKQLLEDVLQADTNPRSTQWRIASTTFPATLPSHATGGNAAATAAAAAGGTATTPSAGGTAWQDHDGSTPRKHAAANHRFTRYWAHHLVLGPEDGVTPAEATVIRDVVQQDRTRLLQRYADLVRQQLQDSMRGSMMSDARLIRRVRHELYEQQAKRSTAELEMEMLASIADSEHRRKRVAQGSAKRTKVG